MRVLLGGVGELFQSDLDVGRLAVERLASAPQQLRRAGLEVLVEELHYGAVAVAQRIQELRPTAVVLFGAVARGDAPGTVRRRRVDTPAPSAEDLQAAVGDAVTGYVGIDLVVEVAGGLGLLPPRTVVVELEPARVGPGERLSDPAARGLETVVWQVRREVARVPVLELAEDLRRRRGAQSEDSSAAGIAMDRLLAALEHVDREGRWAYTFQRRDRLRAAMGRGDTGAVLDRRDWALWWALVEELDLVQELEVASDSG